MEAAPPTQTIMLLWQERRSPLSPRLVASATDADSSRRKQERNEVEGAGPVGVKDDPQASSKQGVGVQRLWWW